jgi:hypothetical protein
VIARRGRRRRERGFLHIRACLAGLVVVVLLLAACVVLLVRVTALPDLGAPPAGPLDGANAAAIALTLAGEPGGVVAQLSAPGSRGAVVTVTERDLGVLAAEYNPEPASFTGVAVRARGGQLVVTANSHLGPLPVLVTARVSLSYRPGAAITPAIREIDVGDQAIPGFMQPTIDSRGASVLSVASLLDGTQLSQFGLECVRVVSGRGVELGFHEPGAGADPGYCAAHPAG